MNRTSSCFVFFILATILSICCPLVGRAQEHEHEHEEAQPIYQRPDFRVYRNLFEANTQPDSVQILELKGKKLKTIPPDVYKYHNLVVLDLGRNKIRVVPDSIGQLSRLEELDLSGNKIDSLPPSIGNLTNLRKLALNRTVITALPPEIGNLANLEEIELWDNELRDLPDEIRNLKKLRKLELRGILFTDEQQKRFLELLPNTKVYMSPACDCKF
jgi:Leucine-rich repeat (LRR) protein